VELKSLKAQWAVEFIDLPKAAHNDAAIWEKFQIDFLNNESRFGIDVKSRQIAWSFTAAVDAYADSRIDPGWPHVFVSINMDEATEKILYLKAILEATDEPARPKIVRDSVTYIEFDDGSRFISHPCRPVRGKAGTRVYLDEMAHYREMLDRQIYLASLPATIKGSGYLRIGSSPLGAKGMFWEIATEGMKKWPGFDGNRNFVPWWQVRALCNNIKTAKTVAPLMQTHERVYQFGNTALIEIFDNMFLEDFQQEYECAWMDEVSAWITWEIIQQNQNADLLHFKANGVDEALALIPKIAESVVGGQMEAAFTGGIDIGRKHDKTELIVCGKGLLGQLPVRAMVTLSNVKYDDQEECLRQIITRLPFTQVLIDQNGIGAQLAENLGRTGKAQGVNFTNATKELWAVQARLEAERNKTPLPPDRDLAYQIHSIKKYVTASKNNVFDAQRNSEHHADKFWAWALAIYAGSNGVEEQTGRLGGNPLGNDYRG
jgi:phage FluMu gp28-like protein